MSSPVRGEGETELGWPEIRRAQTGGVYIYIYIYVGFVSRKGEESERGILDPDLDSFGV